jgi:hypothetical protein
MCSCDILPFHSAELIENTDIVIRIRANTTVAKHDQYSQNTEEDAQCGAASSFVMYGKTLYCNMLDHKRKQ